MEDSDFGGCPDKRVLWREVVPALGGQGNGDLFRHLGQVFGNAGQVEELEIPRKEKGEEIGQLLLNVEILEAKGVQGKDVNGLSDPFCSVFLSEKAKYYTCMKTQTLNPVWKDFFSFPVTSVETEELHVEVWDYDPNESLVDKLKGFKEIKSTRGLKAICKEIAKKTGRSEPCHDFLGRVKLPLRSIPNQGLIDAWWPMGGRTVTEMGLTGQLHLRVALSEEKEKAQAVAQYRQLLHLFLEYELEGRPDLWSGEFDPVSESSLRQLSLVWSLSPKDVKLSKWLVYCQIQTERGSGIHGEVWPILFTAVEKYVTTQKLEEENVQKFYYATQNLVENFITRFQNVGETLTEVGPSTQTIAMLQLLQLLIAHLRGGREISCQLSHQFVMEGIQVAVAKGAGELFCQRVLEQQPGVLPRILDSVRVESFKKFGRVLLTDLVKGAKNVNPNFTEFLGINYFEILYRVYDEKYQNLIKYRVEEICSRLQPIEFSDGADNGDVMTLGTSLFDLYQVLKQFAALSWKCDSSKDLKFWIQGVYHAWFSPVVSLWLDIVHFKALTRIEKAIEGDQLSNGTKEQTSSSAAATIKIVNEMASFWNQLGWPDVQGSIDFLTKILEDYTNIVTYYVEATLVKFGEIDETQESGSYQVLAAFWMAINNCDKIGGAELRLDFLEKCQVKEIGKRLQQMKNKSATELEKRLNSAVDKTGAGVEEIIQETLENVGISIRATMLKMLLDGITSKTGSAENETTANLGHLLQYLTQILSRLKKKLSTKRNFDRMYSILWENGVAALNELIQLNIKEQQPPPYFKRILSAIPVLVGFFHPEKEAWKVDPRILKMSELVRFYTVTMEELILNYCQLREVDGVKASKDLGILTLRVYYSDDVCMLRIDILNARSLKPRHPNGACFPYVKLRLVPTQTFPGAPKFRSNTRKKTIFPLFDESFSFPLSHAEMKGPGLAVFTLRDQTSAMGGRDDFLGECFLPLATIPWMKTGNSVREMSLTYLNITKPKGPPSTIFQTLENRQWDTATVEFVKKEKEKFENLY